jgi:hypothetical protein
LTLCKAPLALPLPRGVRNASNIKAWVMTSSNLVVNEDQKIKRSQPSAAPTGDRVTLIFMPSPYAQQPWIQ